MNVLYDITNLNLIGYFDLFSFLDQKNIFQPPFVCIRMNCMKYKLTISEKDELQYHKISIENDTERG